MKSAEHLELFGGKSLEQVDIDLLMDRVKDYITECSPAFPSFTSSLELVDRIRDSGLVNRMFQVEKEGKHNILSHSLLVCSYAANVSRQLNDISKRELGTFIVDEPLLVTSALIHDIGNIISPEDVDRFRLSCVDISSYTEHFPPTASRDLRKNHILKTIVLIKSFGQELDEHAHTAAHSIYHLLYDPGISFERLLLMLADFSVVSSKNEKKWPRADYVPSLVHKMIEAETRHKGHLVEYQQFFLRLQAVKSLMQEAGVYFPGQLFTISDRDLLSRNNIVPLIVMLKVFNIQRKSIPADHT